MARWFTGLQWALLAIIAILALQYLFLVAFTRGRGGDQGRDQSEGFVGAAQATIPQLAPSEPYDDFYAKVYDQLIQGGDRARFEAQDLRDVLLSLWRPSEVRVLVIGSGTGNTANAIAALGYPAVVGMDRSGAMVNAARFRYPALEFRQADMLTPDTWDAGSFTHIIVPYFTIYYVADKATAFANMAHWVRPRGGLCVHVVNKFRFDPLIESASPFPAFSLQRYMTQNKRLTESDVEFNEFTYKGRFELPPSGHSDDTAHFIETFDFKNGGGTRRQQHDLHMPAVDAIRSVAERAGWRFKKITDMMIIGYEYQYLMYFTRA